MCEVLLVSGLLNRYCVVAFAFLGLVRILFGRRPKGGII